MKLPGIFKMFCTAMILWMVALQALAQDVQMKVKWDTSSINELLNHARKVTMSGRTDSATRLFRLARNQSELLAYDYGYIKGDIGLANIAINDGDFEQALKGYTAAIARCQSRKAKMLLTTLHNNIGNIYTLKGNYEQSAKEYELALSSSEQYGSELPLETIYNNLSIALNRLSQPLRSLFYLDKAEQLALANSNYFTLADIYNNKGSAYTELNDTLKSAACFNDAVSVSRKYGYQNTLYSALVNLGIYYLNGNHVTKAIAKFEEADKIDATINSYYKNLKTLASGAAYLKNKDFAKALPLLQESLAEAGKLGNLRDEITTHTLLSELYRASGDYAKAFEHKSLELQLFDSLKKKETTATVAEMESKYNAALKDKELARRHLTISQQSAALATKNGWIGICIAGIIIIVILVLIQTRNFRHRQKLKNEQLKVLEQQQRNIEMKSILDGAEKERIRLSREIHDSIMVQFSVVKMNLSIYTGSGAQDLTPEKLVPIVQQLDAATDNLRRTAHNLMPDRLVEDGLVEAIFYFCNNLQKSVHICISFQPIGVIPALPVQFELSLYRIIQELMQNVIKHAHADEAIVQLSCEQDLLSVTVEDNGKGMNSEAEYPGLGLKSIEARVNEYGGRFVMDSTPGIGTTVHLEFSVNTVSVMHGAAYSSSKNQNFIS